MHAVAVRPPPEMMPGGVPMALVSIDRAEAEVRAIKEAGARVRALGKD